MGNDKELIDLNKLTQRELLILVATDVRELKVEVEEIKKREAAMALKVNELETRSKVWAGVVGFFAAIVTVLVERLAK